MTNNTIRVAEPQRDYADERRTETCVRCGGDGYVRVDETMHLGIFRFEGYSNHLCPDCGGTGVVSYGEARR